MNVDFSKKNEEIYEELYQSKLALITHQLPDLVAQKDDSPEKLKEWESFKKTIRESCKKEVPFLECPKIREISYYYNLGLVSDRNFGFRWIHMNSDGNFERFFDLREALDEIDESLEESQYAILVGQKVKEFCQNLPHDSDDLDSQQLREFMELFDKTIEDEFQKEPEKLRVSPQKCILCSYGHLAECHYPKRCAEANCSHYQRNQEEI